MMADWPSPDDVTCDSGHLTCSFNRELRNTRCNAVLLVTYYQAADGARLLDLSGLFGYLVCLVDLVDLVSFV